MKTTVEDSGPCRKKLTIELPADRVRTGYDKLADLYARSAKVPGFRPGKAPRQLVEKRYAKQLAADLRDQLVPEAYHEALKAEKIDAVALLDLDEPEVRVGEPMRFTVTLDVPPEFELPEYRQIPVEGHAVHVSADDVEQTIEGLRRQHARYEDVTDRAVQDGDLAQVNFDATCEGRPLEEVAPEAKGLGQAEGFWLNIGEHAFLPELAEGLKGAAIGEERTVEVTFREGFTVKELAGRTAAYRIKATALRGAVLPELTTEFLSRFGMTSEEELRKRVRGDLEESARRSEDARRRDQVARHLIGAAEMSLPATLLQRETRDIVQDIVRENARRGISEQDIIQNKEQIYEAAARNATDSLKLRYLTHKIAEAEKIEVGEEDLAQEIQRLSATHGMEPEALRAQLEKRNGTDELREQLRQRRVMEFLLGQAKLTEAKGDE